MTTTPSTSYPFDICCVALNAPFCASTGRPHTRCPHCNFVVASIATCPSTGCHHFNEQTMTCGDCRAVFIDPPHVMFCAQTGVRHLGPSPAPRPPTPPSPTYSEEFMARVQCKHLHAMRSKRAREFEDATMRLHHQDAPVIMNDDEIYVFEDTSSCDAMNSCDSSEI